MADTPVGVRGAECGEPLTPDRSTGVQQGAYERGVEDGWAWARGGPEPEGVGAVSPEPRCSSVAPFSAGGPLRCELAAGHEGEHYNAGTSSGYWSDREGEPREGEQETREPYLVGCPVDRCVLEEGHAGRHCMGTGEEFTVHEGVIVAVDRGPEPKVEASHKLRNRADSDAIEQSHGDATNEGSSVASVLRLTASRLRDPEYRWSVDPAVTLERLAEELEKGRDDG